MIKWLNGYMVKLLEFKIWIFVGIWSLGFGICLPAIASAQASNFALGSSKVDSLLTLLKTAKEDTNKVNTLLSLADIYSYQNPDSAILFATQANEIAENIKDEKRLA